jgi:hypothetical protein
LIFNKYELTLAYLCAMHDWMNEEHYTCTMVMQRNPSGFSEQQKEEEAARTKYAKLRAVSAAGKTLADVKEFFPPDCK